MANIRDARSAILSQHIQEGRTMLVLVLVLVVLIMVSSRASGIRSSFRKLAIWRGYAYLVSNICIKRG